MSEIMVLMKDRQNLRIVEKEGYKEYLVVRDYKPEATLGKLIDPDAKIGFPPICLTLERPRVYKGVFNRKDDKKTTINESCCFPEGSYLVEWTYSPRFARNMFLINVDGWEGLRIHTANSVDELLGCVAFCVRVIENVKVGGKVYRYWADYGKHTGKALKFLEEIENKLPKKFILTFTSTESLCKVNDDFINKEECQNVIAEKNIKRS